MLLLLSTYNRHIAWFFATCFYLDILFSAKSVQAAPVVPFNWHSNRKIKSWQQYFSENRQTQKSYLIQPAIIDQRDNAGTNVPAAVTAAPEKQFGGGPTQPEMGAFSSVNNANMVDLFTGDFSYNIPLMDVGGYPLNLSYRSGVSMDQEASWVGLGWNVNPGTISRNLRGLPDDFSGKYDSIKKVVSIREDRTVGVTAGGDVEVHGLPIHVSPSLGIFHNSYRGFGLETGLNATINSALPAKSTLTAGLSITNNSQEGITLAPSLSLQLAKNTNGESGSFTLTSPYNSRYGVKSLQLSAGFRQYGRDADNQNKSMGSSASSNISFFSPTVIPAMSIPYTSSQYSFQAKAGSLTKTFHPNLFISGYVSKQGIAPEDSALALPAFGYLHYEDAAHNRTALLDFNREREIPYREKPAVPHIAFPLYTYDAFSITGEGTGGMFRAYRSDIGFVYDHMMKTKDASDRLSADFGPGDIVHGGIDLTINRAYTQSGPWEENNPLAAIAAFHQSAGPVQAAYFRNPGEKAINSEAFYHAIGGDDLAAVKLFQAGSSSPIIFPTQSLNLYKNKRVYATQPLYADSLVKHQRDKRTQVISYLNAKDAASAALSKYIENYEVNQFPLSSCNTAEADEGAGTGLIAEYSGENASDHHPFHQVRVDPEIDLTQANVPAGLYTDYYKANWTGRIKAPVTGNVLFTVSYDDAVLVKIEDSTVFDRSHDQRSAEDTFSLNLIKDTYYKIRVEFSETYGESHLQLQWNYPGQESPVVVPQSNLYLPQVDTLPKQNFITKERRVNSFRKPNHISQITVLNNDGRRYVYGIPVYNLKQREVSFAVDHPSGNQQDGLAEYTDGIDNTTWNRKGRNWYYSSEETPAYAHSFLLTGIVSPDYTDITGNGISDDDPGDAIRFNYSKVRGIKNPYKWRAPYVKDSVSYNEGLKTDLRDDKGNYVYGEKELWYLNSIQSKTMIATFTLEGREDLLSIDEAGHKVKDGSAKRLKEINLYSKADWLANGSNARPVKTVHFEYSYSLCRGMNSDLDLANDSGKLTLEKVWFSYNGNTKGKLNPYVFHYSNNKPYQQKAYDRWGNYKDPLQNPGSQENAVIGNNDYPYALQDSLQAAENASAWALDSIALPSGGTMKVDYESDDYGFVQNKRAMQMTRFLGFASAPALQSGYTNTMYTESGDQLYVYFRLPCHVSDARQLYSRYLDDITKLYFKFFVKMPSSDGGGYEYVSGYATMETQNGYGLVNDSTAWIKVRGITSKGEMPGDLSPFAKTAIQFLKFNLPAQAYPGSEIGDEVSSAQAVRMLFSSIIGLKDALSSFDRIARRHNWVQLVDLNRSYIRLDDPYYKKLGGGHRVKRIKIYDNWDKMTGQRAAVYGQEYLYTTKREINGQPVVISSGVASYEPAIGGEENPFHQPIEYIQSAAVLGPVGLGYSEEPIGEALFPSPSVGYGKVRVRTINYKNRKSANGFEETQFYTTYDFPTYTERTILDGEGKKRYKSPLQSFLRINAVHQVAISQGFKVELNDMNGKLRSKAWYPETDPDHYISYTANVYKMEDPSADHKRLSNTVMVIHPDGSIDSSALIGEDIELMMDMREHRSITEGFNVNLDADLFTAPTPVGFLILPGMLNLYQREEDMFRSVATVKVIQRYGILDSVVQIDKGSRISTKDILYDSETGDVLLSRTQNEFNDPVYNFTYPSHWAYDGMGLAYKNIDAILDHVFIKNGRITSLPGTSADSIFSSGDEILVGGRLPTGGGDCLTDFSSFPAFDKIWVIDSSVIHGGTRALYFIDKEGKPYNAADISLRIIRSGRRNLLAAAGSVTSLANPVQKDENGVYHLVLDSATNAVAASAATFKQLWNIEDNKAKGEIITCTSEPPGNDPDSITNCGCLKTLFDYLQFSHRLFIQQSANVTVQSLVTDAIAAGFYLNIESCPVLNNNKNGLFYALTSDSVGTDYRSQLGNCVASITANSALDFYQIQSQPCDGSSVGYIDTIGAGPSDSITKTFYPTKSLVRYNVEYNSDGLIPYPTDTGVDINSNRILSLYRNTESEVDQVESYVKFDSVNNPNIPTGSEILSATLYLYADSSGINPPQFPNAHAVWPIEKFAHYVISTPYFYWDYNTPYSGFSGSDSSPYWPYGITDSNQNLIVNAKDFVVAWLANGNNGLHFNANFTTSYTTFASEKYPNALMRPKLVISYYPPPPIVAELSLESCLSCDTLVSTICTSTIVDTAFNPYATGALGNWRSNRSYTYYSNREQADPSVKTNIRTDGAIKNFSPFWVFDNGKIVAQPDTSRWVWNSETTIFNRKGVEIENKDPLGRYNSGLYGYNENMPVAVTQNARFREAAFEGFEDYGFTTQLCDTACPPSRNVDFSSYASQFDTSIRHTGRYSLKVNADGEANIAFPLSTEEDDSLVQDLQFATQTSSCTGNPVVLKDIKAGRDILLPSFSPLKGKRMLLSAWVTEDLDCKCSTFVNNTIIVSFVGSAQSFEFHPTGNIIEGWQRYEAVFDIPEDATDISVSLQSSGGVSAWFDDVRLHPYNANMKSFVYDPLTLRLMAELDENNFATFYEYDDDGTLIRVKKETERGIKTIKETRSALLKD